MEKILKAAKKKKKIAPCMFSEFCKETRDPAASSRKLSEKRKKERKREERMSHLSQGSHDSVYGCEKCETAAVKVGRNLLRVAEGLAAKAHAKAKAISCR